MKPALVPLMRAVTVMALRRTAGGIDPPGAGRLVDLETDNGE